MNREMCTKRMARLLVFLVFGAMMGISHAVANDIDWQVVSSGGTEGESGTYRLSGTLSQTAVDTGSSGSYLLRHGFWQDFGSGCCIPPIRGDVKLDGSPGELGIDVADLVYLVNYMFKKGPPPQCFEEADVNADCQIDIADLVYLVNYMFKQGPAPKPCPV